MLEFAPDDETSAKRPAGSNRGPSLTPMPRSVPVGDWPAADRAAWERAIAPRARLGKGGAGAHLAPITQNDLARRYGYFIGHLMRKNLLDPEALAASRVTKNHIASFIDDLRARVGSVTVAQTIYKLRRIAQLLDPNRDFGWLGEIEKDLALVMRPKSKDHRLVDPDRLFEAGLALIEEAAVSSSLTPLRRARQVRNGLMIALLALCPIRLKNFAALELQTSFRSVGARWWIVLDRKETKSRRPDERRVPKDLDAGIEAYLRVHRPVLAAIGRRTKVEIYEPQNCPSDKGSALASNADLLATITGPLWLGCNTGQPMSYYAIERAITETTRLALGVAVSPHLFRACAATAIYTHAGDNPNLASGVLQHIDRRVTAAHYNRAASISAARQYAEIVKRTRG